MKRFLSFTLIPHSKEATHSRKFPLLPVLLLMGSILFFSVALGIFIRNHLRTSIKTSDLTLQEEKNSSLSEKVKKYDETITDMKNEMKKLKGLHSKMDESLPLQLNEPMVLMEPPSIEKEFGSPFFELEDVQAKLLHLSREISLQKGSFLNIVKIFEEDPQISKHLPSILPVHGWIVSGFGDRENPFTGRTEIHEGMDIATLPGSNILATGDGIVRTTGYRLDLGYFLILDHGYSLTTTYGHCSKLKARVGESIKRGETIAFTGLSGKTLGPCVHYEVRIMEHPVDPLTYILSPPIRDLDLTWR